MLFFLPQKRNPALAQDVVIKDQFGRLVRHTKTHVERQQMLLPGVTVACGRRFLPLDQALFTLGLGQRAGAYLDQPILKGIIGWIRRVDSLPGKCSHVVERKSRSDHQDILMHQFAQRSAKGDVRGRVKTAQQRKLKRGDIGLRVHQFQWDKQAMVKSPLGIDVSRYIVLRNNPAILFARSGLPGAG